MNPAFALAIVVLIGILGFASWGRRSGPPSPARRRLGVMLAIGAVLVAVSLLAPRALWLALGALGVYATLSRLAGNRGGGFPGGASNPGPPSSIETNFLRAHLDHETGEMDAEVTNGPWQGKRLSQLSVEDLQALHGFLLGADVQSARILETYLDREHEGWRDAGQSTSEGDGAARSGGPAMDERRALEILGLEPGASRDDVISAHRRLINRLHPDRGGSSYLATEINLAKDYLVKRH